MMRNTVSPNRPVALGAGDDADVRLQQIRDGQRLPQPLEGGYYGKRPTLWQYCMKSLKMQVAHVHHQ